MSYYKEYLEYKSKYENLLEKYNFLSTDISMIIYKYPLYNKKIDMKLYIDRNNKEISIEEFVELEKNCLLCSKCKLDSRGRNGFSNSSIPPKIESTLLCRGCKFKEKHSSNIVNDPLYTCIKLIKSF